MSFTNGIVEVGATRFDVPDLGCDRLNALREARRPRRALSPEEDITDLVSREHFGRHRAR